jgi:hypothetical protein
MLSMPGEQQPNDVVDVAKQLARRLEAEGHDYALGGAIALGYWGRPRGTLDVDVTIYLSPDKPSECVRVLQQLGCDLVATKAHHSVAEYGFCQVEYAGFRVDVFLPTIPFYEAARTRRKEVKMEDQSVYIWDAETLCVFKMMFFRDKDSTDLKQILRVQGSNFNRDWVRDHLVHIYGQQDPRISRWDEFVGETDSAG